MSLSVILVHRNRFPEQHMLFFLCTLIFRGLDVGIQGWVRYIVYSEQLYLELNRSFLHAFITSCIVNTVYQMFCVGVMASCNSHAFWNWKHFVGNKFSEKNRQ